MTSQNLRLADRPRAAVGMLVRADQHTVYETFADPARATRFWYSHSTGRMESGSQLTWTWDFYGVSDTVHVLKAEQDRRLVWEWHEGNRQTVEMSFEAREGGTFVQVTESPADGSGDEQVAAAIAAPAGLRSYCARPRCWSSTTWPRPS